MKNTPIDISQCDLEPIRFINAIQEFGAIIVTDENSVIRCVSENFFEFTEIPETNLLNHKYSDLTISKDKFHMSETKVGKLNVIQFEKRTLDQSSTLNNHFDQLQKSSTLKELLINCATIIADLSDFDRVMIYKFHDDFHGEVVAEKTKPGIESFFGLHYPASDIPTPARAIFLENWIRMIPDVHYKPVALTTNIPGIIDLGQVLVRAVSPIHIQYLQNMGVGATLTISIIVDDKLWGLIACHNNSAKFVSRELRDKCEGVGRFTSSMIKIVALKEKTSHSDNIRKIHQDVGARLLKTDDMAKELATHSPTLLDLINAKGASAALYVDGYWANIGITPTEEQLNKMVDWLSKEHKDEVVFETNELSLHYPESKSYKDICSGLLALTVPKTSRNYILWFRPEVIQTVVWAGNPDKNLSAVDGKLHPRASFHAWKNEVNSKSLPWESWEIEAAIELRNLILATDLKKQFEKEQKARNEAERAKEAREDLMAVVSHDLKNPLNSIQMNTQLLKRLVAPEDNKSYALVERVLRSATTMNNLINDILSIAKLQSGQFEIIKDHMPLKKVIKECIDMLMPLAADKNIKLSMVKTDFECDLEYDFDRMMQVLSNLVGNAIKFTPDGGKITVEIEKCGPNFAKIRVTDTGPGIPEDNLRDVFDRFWQANQAKRLGTGLGLSIAKGIIEAHGGEIWVESKAGEGSVFQFTLPL